MLLGSGLNSFFHWKAHLSTLSKFILNSFTDSFILKTFETREISSVKILKSDYIPPGPLCRLEIKTDVIPIYVKIQNKLVFIRRFDHLKLLFVRNFQVNFVIEIIMHLQYHKILS